MGEQPIFTTKAHVFQIDPNTKKKWLPASTQAVNVSYYYDSTRNSYRIISVEGSKAVINSTITPNMTFTKTSQKFGQWMDPRANTVYGLGFTSEGELSKFVEKFKEVKELTRQAQGSSQSNGTEANHAPATPPMSNSPVNVHKPPSSVSSQNDLNERRNSGSSIQGSESQLKYENDRLKIALAQSSANAKKWEIELQTLKNNNARLTTALQESTSNVEEWKKQLAMYKEESARMKKRVVELEKGGGASGADQQHIRELTDRVQQLETMNRRKEEELNDLTTRVQELAPMEEKNQILTEKMQKLEEENKQMTSQVGSLEIQLNSTRTSATRERQQLRDLEEQLGRKLTDIQRIHDQVTSTLQQQT